MKSVSPLRAQLHVLRPGAEHTAQRPPIMGVVLCTAIFVFCVLLSIAPLNRLAGSQLFLGLPITPVLTVIGTWLPVDLGLTTDAHASQMSTHTILFLTLVAGEFLSYALCLWFISRQGPDANFKRSLIVVLAGVIIGGLALVLTPALLSRDAFVYAGYGRIAALYHTSPYFVTLSAYPHDPFILLDDWKDAPAAYGPLWLFISALGALVAGDHPLTYLYLYRGLGLIGHLLNVLLIRAILRTQGCSQRTTTFATIVYALNPLALQESCLGGHNDICMVTLLLLGIFSWVRAENRGRQSWHASLPALIFFTLAALIKFTGAVLVGLFIVLLVRKSFCAGAKFDRGSAWKAACITLIRSALICSALALSLYIPFWMGHTIQEIIHSFLSPPSANAAYGSILAAIRDGMSQSSRNASPLMRFFSLHSTWSALNIIVLAAILLLDIIWLWRQPTTRTFILAALAVLTALLIITPWFFPWYVTWLIGLAAVSIPYAYKCSGRALVSAALAFSASAFAIYLYFHNLPPIGGWSGLACLTTIGPPILAYFFCPISERLFPALARVIAGLLRP
ncbi:hypothetical protein EPA93_20325 [Ktedonosporobacter rubrisoli]|uniref:DUF2029 domain-containing protein n=1 Tax=Ktedonosporobacter rubrisoli TaxID=2509675 RepID=A0A4P6JRU9_KTERU|nr:hypothetical protein [Ktedonosporobacter rubrisoli]QBD78218.1 hypothetical protein EPA93_20325 [Ktedonosporobacter rubrisoli]